MKMEVYCMDCKNHELWGNYTHVCKLDVYKNELGERMVSHKMTCQNRNKNKDCSGFKARFFKKLKYKELKK